MLFTSELIKVACTVRRYQEDSKQGTLDTQGVLLHELFLPQRRKDAKKDRKENTKLRSLSFASFFASLRLCGKQSLNPRTGKDNQHTMHRQHVPNLRVRGCARNKIVKDSHQQQTTYTQISPRCDINPARSQWQ